MAWRIFGDDGAQNGPVVPLRPGDPLVTLEALILASLLSDARDQAQPVPRGWWGDAYDTAGDRFGSRLWTIPALITDETLRQTEECVNEALAWMVRDGLCKSVTSAASRDAATQIRLDITIDGAVALTLGGP